jgi:hypothetical protein
LPETELASSSAEVRFQKLTGREGPLLADFVEEVGELAVSERIGIQRA